jgi:TPR repeat protein
MKRELQNQQLRNDMKSRRQDWLENGGRRKRTKPVKISGLTVITIFWFATDSVKREADRGSAMAQYDYAVHLLGCNGGPSTQIEAARYLKASADQGFVSAQTTYGICLHNGIGVSID